MHIYVGETQAHCKLRQGWELKSKENEQKLVDSCYGGEVRRAFMLHLQYAAFATGEVGRRFGSPSQLENIGRTRVFV